RLGHHVPRIEAARALGRALGAERQRQLDVDRAASEGELLARMRKRQAAMESVQDSLRARAPLRYHAERLRQRALLKVVLAAEARLAVGVELEAVAVDRARAAA